MNIRFASILVGVGAVVVAAGAGAAHAQLVGAGVSAPSPALAAPAAPSTQASLGPAWLPGFGAPDMDNQVSAFVNFDDGSGPALFAGGRFELAGGVIAKRIAKLEGSNWAPLGSGVNGEVNCLAVYDDGNGPALYAGGSFSMAGGVSASGIAKWDGASWSALGSGLGGAPPIGVTSLAAFDDGNGPALYAGGFFTTAGGAPATRIAKWNGSTWSALGTGINNVVRSLIVFDDGGGPDLYAGGEFSTAGGVTASGIARWNGAAWSAVWNFGFGTPGVNGWVYSMAVFDDGLPGGSKLFVTGSFSGAGIKTASSVARWDGANWDGVGGGIAGLGYALIVHDDGGGDGPALYVGGDFITAGGAPAKYTAKWNGTSWSAQDSGMNNLVRTLAVHDDGSGDGPALYAGGDFLTAGGVTVSRCARWNGTAWAGVGSGLNGQVLALASFDDGNGGGPALYAGGVFTTAAGVPANRIARWDGTSWSALGTGITSLSPSIPAFVQALAVFDDGSGGGPALYAAGDFPTAGGVSAKHVAKWNGTSWSALGMGLNDQVRALAVFDDGSGEGPALFAGGWFTTGGGPPALRIAKWDGASWSAVGGGTNAFVDALLVFDDGSGGGSALYVAGSFTTAGGVPANRMARWNGTSWSNLGSGMNNQANALAAFDDGGGGGPALYAGGFFTTADGAPANRIAKWNGANWSPLGSGVDIYVRALAAFDDGGGGGPALYAGGAFLSAGGTPVNRIASWDGASWSPLGSGINNQVDTLAVHDDGQGGGPALFVGGNFTTAGDLGGGRLAKWGCPPPPSAWSDQGSALAGALGDPLFTGSGPLIAGSNNSVDLGNAAPSAPAALFVAFASTPAAFKGGTLLAFPIFLTFVLATNPAGDFPLPFVMPPGVPASTELWLQWAIQDAGAVQGVALSNAIRGLVP